MQRYIFNTDTNTLVIHHDVVVEIINTKLPTLENVYFDIDQVYKLILKYNPYLLPDFALLGLREYLLERMFIEMDLSS